jgi:hypothetical protein
MSRNAVFLTGNGASDDHGGEDWYGESNNWVTTAWSPDTTLPSLLAALEAGQVSCGSLGERMPVIIPGSVIEALRVFATLLTNAQVAGYLPPLLLQAMPWSRSLPVDDLSKLVSELADAADSGAHAPERLAALIREWRATAEIYADPAEVERLRQALREATEGKAAPWEYDDAST